MDVPHISATGLETPSGKDAGDENFPVGSILIRPGLRRHVHALYRFARAADDIADNPVLPSDDKVRRLAAMAAVIRGADGAASDFPSAAKMRLDLVETGITPQHCLDLLAAFSQDAVKARYRDVDDLLAYCFLSAAPIGRYLLDLHGEGPACRTASDALCNALQIVNHLQDCGEDYRDLDRIYLPEDLLDEAAASADQLGTGRLSPGLRRVVDRLLDVVDGLLAECGDIVREVRDTRIALECQVIRGLCVRLATRLRNEDPLATRVELSKPVAVVVAGTSLIRGLGRRFQAPVGVREPAAVR